MTGIFYMVMLSSISGGSTINRFQQKSSSSSPLKKDFGELKKGDWQIVSLKSR